MQLLINIFKYFIEILFPRDLTCVLCDRELFNINEGNLCDICMGSLQFIVGDTCNSCGRMIPTSNKYKICNNCLLLDRYFDIGVAVIRYDDYSKKIFFDFKYYQKKYIAHTMAVFLNKRLIKLNLDLDIDYFVPVPLSKEKIRKRGYNQAELICKYLSEITGIKTLDCLIRIKDTKALNGLNNNQRRDILKEAFSIKENIDIKNNVIVLVDDIFTTGSTVNACSKVLKENKVIFIISACFGIGE